MDGKQQREHRSHMQQIEAETARAVLAAAERLDALERARTALEQFQKNIEGAHSNLVRAVSDLALDHGVTRGLVDGTGSAFIAFTRRGFWSRLNWLITGR